MASMAKTWPLTLAIAALVIVPGGFFYLVTTFLFAFSGGQYRMVAVVNGGALIVIAAGVAAAVIMWRLRSPVSAVKWSAAVTSVGWITAIVAEWLLSFSLGA